MDAEPVTAGRRSIRYRDIADALRHRVAGGEFSAGRVLPSEAELSVEYDASRVTVRRALEVLRDEGVLDARQGFGWFVAAPPIHQTLGRLETIEDQMEASGIKPERRVVSFAFVPARGRVREVLGPGEVLEVQRVNLADGRPFALVTVWCPAVLAQHLSRADVERTTFYELLPVELGGAVQTIGASTIAAREAGLLEVPAGSTVLRCERMTQSAEGRSILLSIHVFPAHLTEFVVNLPHATPSIAPTGLRLVDR